MSKRGGNVVSFAHERLTTWGDRRDSLGTPSAGPLSRVSEGSVTAAGSRPSGTHGDPTMSLQIRDENVYACERAVQELSAEDQDTANILLSHYYRGLSDRSIATEQGISRIRVQEQLLTGQAWVGCFLLRGPKPQHRVRESEETAA